MGTMPEQVFMMPVFPAHSGGRKRKRLRQLAPSSGQVTWSRTSSAWRKEHLFFFFFSNKQCLFAIFFPSEGLFCKAVTKCSPPTPARVFSQLWKLSNINIIRENSVWFFIYSSQRLYNYFLNTFSLAVPWSIVKQNPDANIFFLRTLHFLKKWAFFKKTQRQKHYHI